MGVSAGENMGHTDHTQNREPCAKGTFTFGSATVCHAEIKVQSGSKGSDPRYKSHHVVTQAFNSYVVVTRTDVSACAKTEKTDRKQNKRPYTFRLAIIPHAERAKLQGKLRSSDSKLNNHHECVRANISPVVSFRHDKDSKRR